MSGASWQEPVGALPVDRTLGAAALGRTAPAGGISPAALAGLGSAAAATLERYATGLTPEPEALEAVARVARAARRAGVPAERVVAAIKAAWYALPVVRQQLGLAETRERLGRVVAACVEGYFEDSSTR